MCYKGVVQAGRLESNNKQRDNEYDYRYYLRRIGNGKHWVNVLLVISGNHCAGSLAVI